MLSAAMLKEFAHSLGIPACGVCSAGRDNQLAACLQQRRDRFSACDFEEKDIDLRCNPSAWMPDARSVFVCLFPYHIGSLSKGNLSVYAMVPDYHKVVGNMLAQVADFIQAHEPTAQCKSLCDAGPQVDRWLAYRAGLGFYGKNNMLIHPVYGSYFFIGSLLLNLPLSPDGPLAMSCAECDACLAACPGGALSEDFGFDCEKCISYLTQKKEVTKEQQTLLHGQKSVYGCDACQRVCPHNQNMPDTPIVAFHENSVTQLCQAELEGLSGREFKRKYADYAFSWCSKKTILKNFR